MVCANMACAINSMSISNLEPECKESLNLCHVISSVPHREALMSTCSSWLHSMGLQSHTGKKERRLGGKGALLDGYITLSSLEPR